MKYITYGRGTRKTHRKTMKQYILNQENHKRITPERKYLIPRPKSCCPTEVLSS